MKPMSQLAMLCPESELAEGQIRAEFLPNGTVIALYRAGGQLFATDDTCTHGAASLSEDGTLHGHEVECSWHFGRFDIRTGAACASPCQVALRTYAVSVVDGTVAVEYDE
jgi:p-cumate 2,3-dioxygenase ferredoxin subunit